MIHTMHVRQSLAWVAVLGSALACTPGTPKPKPEEQAPTPVEAPVEPTPTIAAKPSPPPVPLTAVQRWSIDIPRTPPLLANPPPKSILARVPEADATAIVATKRGLELVAVGAATPWRMTLTDMPATLPLFEPATALVIWLHKDSIWAVDLAEPLSDSKNAKPQRVEIARRTEPIDWALSGLSLCIPDADSPTYETCWPPAPRTSQIEEIVEYLAVYWVKNPAAAWTRNSLYGKEDDYPDDDPAEINLKMVGSEWLRARADRRVDFEWWGGIHAFIWATVPAAKPAFADRCIEPEMCGKSLPFGISDWDYVVIRTWAGDLEHLEFALYSPLHRRWANLEGLADGTSGWVPDRQFSVFADDLGEEIYPRFDGGRPCIRNLVRGQTVPPAVR